jgi:dTDP-4-dehydrorhamnose 3,5-epimerase
MEFIPSEIPEVVHIRPAVFTDDRGFFVVDFNQEAFRDRGLPECFVQQNLSGSRHGVLRGLHYQSRFPQGKLVRVTTGRIFDVAVDLRRSSPTFGRWVGLEVASDTHDLLWVPPGFAHGFYVLSDWAEVSYSVTDRYAPEFEHTIRWDDPDLGIRWPIPDGETPVLSPKDAAGVSFKDAAVFDQEEQ